MIFCVEFPYSMVTLNVLPGFSSSELFYHVLSVGSGLQRAFPGVSALTAAFNIHPAPVLVFLLLSQQ